MSTADHASLSESGGGRNYDPLFEPLALAMGHMILAAAQLERALCVDLIRRRIVRDGAEEVFGKRVVSELLRRPAGPLLGGLRELGFEGELAQQISGAIVTRNEFVHHLFDDPDFIRAFPNAEGVDRVAERIEALAGQIYDIIEKLAPDVTDGAEALFGRSGRELLEAVKEIDAEQIEDDELREHLKAVQALPDRLQ